VQNQLSAKNGKYQSLPMSHPKTSGWQHEVIAKIKPRSYIGFLGGLGQHPKLVVVHQNSAQK
jgi:hypothetical protein